MSPGVICNLDLKSSLAAIYIQDRCVPVQIANAAARTQLRRVPDPWRESCQAFLCDVA